MLIVLGYFDIELVDKENATKFAIDMASQTNEETGCISYNFGWDLNVPGRLLLQEKWESLDCLLAHFETDHMRRFREELQTIAIEDARAARYEIDSIIPIPVGRAETKSS